ncbi:polysaccharide deacetylase family protein [Paenibacillus odorifer]|uniref:polysaccharide deacetylase family protein n=1 Tax=Paenibacillus odorifer TaxID=189426 RepID=UPI0004F5A38C|nr:polysaccharide deacetylase family protein [Paenibacillus odorifer]AIQ73409.1 xylanase deacetylase [Paenibacillus odorifer]
MSEYKDFAHDKKRRQRIKRNRRGLLFIVILLCIFGFNTMIVKKPVVDKHVKRISIANKEEMTVVQTVSEDVVASSIKYEVEDIVFVEKYLKQQISGDMPEGANGEKIAYLSFDDGPSETVTPKILDVLQEAKVPATFFVLGKEVDKSDVTKNLIKRMIEEGHAVANHSYSHNYEYLYPNKKVNLAHFMNDIEKTNNSLKRVLGEDFAIRAVRYPGGHMTWVRNDPRGVASLDEALNAKGFHYVDWNVLPKDAEGAPKKAAELMHEFTKTVAGREKAVILMHDTYGKEETAKALPEMIKYLKDHDYKFRTMK